MVSYGQVSYQRQSQEYSPGHREALRKYDISTGQPCGMLPSESNASASKAVANLLDCTLSLVRAQSQPMMQARKREVAIQSSCNSLAVSYAATKYEAGLLTIACSSMLATSVDALRIDSP